MASKAVRKVMENVKNAKYSQKSIDQAFQKLVYLVDVTIKRVFNNNIPAGMELEDLVQEGSIALLNCIKNYNPSKKVNFETYAITSISRMLWRAVADSAWSPSAKRKEWRISRKVLNLCKELGREPTVNEIAEAIGKDVAVTRVLLNLAAHNDPIHFSDVVATGEGNVSVGDLFGSPNNVENEAIINQRNKYLMQAIESLTSECRQAILLRAQGYAYKEIAEAMKTSVNHVGWLLKFSRHNIIKWFCDNNLTDMLPK